MAYVRRLSPSLGIPDTGLRRACKADLIQFKLNLSPDLFGNGCFCTPGGEDRCQVLALGVVLESRSHV